MNIPPQKVSDAFGQTTLEYLVLFAVITVLAVAMFRSFAAFNSGEQRSLESFFTAAANNIAK